MRANNKSMKQIITFNDVKDYALITLGLFLYAAGLTVFILPYQLITGGLTGACAMVYYVTGIPVGYSYFIVNAVLLGFALKILGFKFMTKTIFGIFVVSMMFNLLQQAVTLPDGSMYMLLGEGQDFMSIILGAAVSGIGLAVIFLNGGSTGGTDIIAMIVNKYRDLSLGRVLMLADLVIISSSYFLFEDWRKIVFGLVLMFLENWVLDYVMTNRTESVQFLIISKKYKQIAHEVGTKVGRGITILDGHGWYSGAEVKVLCILAKRREMPMILRFVKAIDINAFVSVASVRGVYGEGFERIKLKAKKEEQLKLEVASE